MQQESLHSDCNKQKSRSLRICNRCHNHDTKRCYSCSHAYGSRKPNPSVPTGMRFAMSGVIVSPVFKTTFVTPMKPLLPQDTHAGTMTMKFSPTTPFAGAREPTYPTYKAHEQPWVPMLALKGTLLRPPCRPTGSPSPLRTGQPTTETVRARRQAEC